MVRFCKEIGFSFFLVFFASIAFTDDLPIRGLHVTSVNPNDIELYSKFISEELRGSGINTLVLEINYNYQFESHPELAGRNALSKDDLKHLLAVCRDAEIELIPLINCLGHQSWSRNTFSLLTKYPEFDASPGKYPNNEDIYCRSYCTLHPGVHKIMFALIDELMDVCEAKSVHVGMDEVFLLNDGNPYCAGKSNAELFAHEVEMLYNHLKQSDRTLWLWGDRLIDGDSTGIGEWEASKNDTAAAIDMIPKDIMICDWHYEKAHPTAIYFAMKGFNVLSCPWRKPEVALGQLELIKHARANAHEKVASRMKGMMQTSWGGFSSFIRAYHGEGDGRRGESMKENAECFKALLKAMKE